MKPTWSLTTFFSGRAMAQSRKKHPFDLLLSHSGKKTKEYFFTLNRKEKRSSRRKEESRKALGAREQWGLLCEVACGGQNSGGDLWYHCSRQMSRD